MSTEPARTERLVVVVARYTASAGAPPGIDPKAFAAACLADTYELAAELVGVDNAVAGGAEVAGLLWPAAHHLPAGDSIEQLATWCVGRYRELVVLPADVPDLPGLVVAKVFQALQRADVCVAPSRSGAGAVALGVRVPQPAWLPAGLDLDADVLGLLRAHAPSRRAVATAPEWHRLNTPAAIRHLDPGLEGWEQTRALLAGRPLDIGREA